MGRLTGRWHRRWVFTGDTDIGGRFGSMRRRGQLVGSRERREGRVGHGVSGGGLWLCLGWVGLGLGEGLVLSGLCRLYMLPCYIGAGSGRGQWRRGGGGREGHCWHLR